MNRIRIDNQLEKSVLPFSLIVTDNNNKPFYFPMGGEGMFLQATAEGLVYVDAPTAVNSVDLWLDNELTYITWSLTNGLSGAVDVTEKLYHWVAVGSSIFKIHNNDTVNYKAKGINLSISNLGQQTNINFEARVKRQEFINLTQGNTVTIPAPIYNVFDVKRNGLTCLSDEYTLTYNGSNIDTSSLTVSFTTNFSNNESVIVLGF